MVTADKIKLLRKERSLTQKELGEISGLSEQMIRNYEVGIRNPKIGNLQKIANALEVPVTELLSKSIIVKISPDFTNPKLLKELDEKATKQSDILSDIAGYFYELDDLNAQEQLRTLVEHYFKLNEDARKKIADTAADMYELKKYRRGKK